METETIHFPQERTDNPFTPRGRGIRNPFISFQEGRHPSQGRDHHKVPLRVPGLLPVRSSSTSKERSNQVTFSVTPVPTEHSSDHPQMTLTVARLYIEPTLKRESGPTGDPVVSDPLHPSGMYLPRDRTLTQVGRNRRSCPP